MLITGYNLINPSLEKSFPDRDLNRIIVVFFWGVFFFVWHNFEVIEWIMSISHDKVWNQQQQPGPRTGKKKCNFICCTCCIDRRRRLCHQSAWGGEGGWPEGVVTGWLGAGNKLPRPCKLLSKDRSFAQREIWTGTKKKKKTCRPLNSTVIKFRVINTLQYRLCVFLKIIWLNCNFFLSWKYLALASSGRR